MFKIDDVNKNDQKIISKIIEDRLSEFLEEVKDSDERDSVFRYLMGNGGDVSIMNNNIFFRYLKTISNNVKYWMTSKQNYQMVILIMTTHVSSYQSALLMYILD
jgi:hypothetical protein